MSPAAESLFGNYEGRCGEGFWLWPRRRVPRIPAAGCKERANAGHGQKTRRPEGFRGKCRLASLRLSRRSTRDILLRRASPSGLFPENSAPRSFQTGSKTLEFSSSRLITTGPNWKSELPWTTFRGFSVVATYFYHKLSDNGIASVLPKSAFTPESQQLFREYAKAGHA